MAIAALLNDALAAGDRWVRTTQGGRGDAWPPHRDPSFTVRHLRLRSRSSKLFDDARWQLLRLALEPPPPAPAATMHVLRVWEGAYRPLSRSLAALLAREWRQSPTPLLLQDYDLHGTASVLRDLVPEAQIGLFCHSAFPDPTALRTLPHVVVIELLHGLLACDVVTFRTHHDMGGFLGLVSRVLGIRIQGGQLSWRGRAVRVDVLPPTVDIGELRADGVVSRPDCAPLPADALAIVWIGPSHPVGAPLSAIAAFGRLLELEPSLDGRARLFLHVSSHDAVPGAQQDTASIVDAAAAVNAQLARDSWIPVAVDLSDSGARRRASIEHADVVVASSLATMGPGLAEAVALGYRRPALVVGEGSVGIGGDGQIAVPLTGLGPDAIASALLAALRLSPGERERRLAAAGDAVTTRFGIPWLEEQTGALMAGGRHLVIPDHILPSPTVGAT